MLNNDDCSKTIITEYVGPDVRQLFSTNTERNIYLPLVKIAYNKLFSEYGLHHNDLVWKNITIKDNKAYFIDLGRVRPQLLDEDSQQILKNIQLEINNFNDLFDLNT